MFYDIFIFLLIQFFTILLVVIYYRLKTGAIKEALKKQTQKLEQTSVRLNRTIEQLKFLENERNNMQADSSKLRKTQDQLQQQLKAANANTDEQEARIQFLETYRTQSAELSEQLHQMHINLQAVNSQLTSVKNDKSAIELQLTDQIQQSEAMKNTLLQLTQIKRQHEQLQPKAELMAEELAQLHNTNAALETDKKQLGNQLMEAKLTISNLEKQIALLEGVTKEYTGALNRIELLQKNYAELKQKYEVLKEANKHLQVQTAEMKELSLSYKKTISVLENGRHPNS